jgi:phospholipase C
MDVPGSPASDQHPPHHLMAGERLIAWVYDTLRSNPALWRRTLLLLLYDEHGGFYDHVPPPAAAPPDDASAGSGQFTFDRLGVRVPALLISPWVRKGRADHRVYDHTSLLATLKGLFGLPAFLTRRDASANPLDDADFLETPRALDDTPANLGALLAGRPSSPPRKSKLSDLQQSLLLLQQIQGTPGPAGGARPDPQSP